MTLPSDIYAVKDVATPVSAPMMRRKLGKAFLNQSGTNTANEALGPARYTYEGSVFTQERVVVESKLWFIVEINSSVQAPAPVYL
jgi:hypothetical protein